MGKEALSVALATAAASNALAAPWDQSLTWTDGTRIGDWTGRQMQPSKQS